MKNLKRQKTTIKRKNIKLRKKKNKTTVKSHFQRLMDGTIRREML